MSSNCKVIQCLEWCTTLPSIDRPQESSVFFLQGNEWYFRLVYEKFLPSWYCELYLELKNEHIELKPCSVSYQVGFKNEQTLSLAKGDFKTSKHYEVWCLRVSDLYSKLPADYMDGNWIKLLFYFDDVVEPLFQITKKTDDKSVQTPSYIDTNFMLEGVSKDLSSLLDEGPNHDVEFICGDEIVKAHKNVISSRSDVFASMLQSDMEEGKTGQVKIVDTEISIFRQFLRCLYTGRLPELTVDTALRFYEAADKYAVESLKKQCASFLTENLSLENACDVLIMSDRHTDLDFKKTVLEYIMKEKMPKRIGEKWADFCKENQSLANEVLNFLYQNLP